jgi:hypothetical protein
MTTRAVTAAYEERLWEKLSLNDGTAGLTGLVVAGWSSAASVMPESHNLEVAP